MKEVEKKVERTNIRKKLGKIRKILNTMETKEQITRESENRILLVLFSVLKTQIGNKYKCFEGNYIEMNCLRKAGRIMILGKDLFMILIRR